MRFILKNIDRYYSPCTIRAYFFIEASNMLKKILITVAIAVSLMTSDITNASEEVKNSLKESSSKDCV